MIDTKHEARRRPVPWYRNLYIQVLLAIGIGVCTGWWFPEAGTAMKPLGDGFIALIKMMIAPVIFCTVVHGIGSMGDLKKVGRVGLKTLIYFEVVSTAALAIGLFVGEIVQPGKGFNIDPATLDAAAVSHYVARAHEDNVVAHLLSIIPGSFFGALAEGNLLQVLLISILSGFAIAHMGASGQRIGSVIDLAGRLFFRIIGMIVQVAPIGAFGAMAFTVGAYGVSALWNLIELIRTFHASSRRLTASARVQRLIAELRPYFSSAAGIVGVDRLDYTKDLPLRLRAFERFLEEAP
jgi:aerobic C4-dicarboxylate transport protein